VLLILPIILGVFLYTSWHAAQVPFQDHRGRTVLKYSQNDSLWKRIDYAAFRALNGTMRDSRPMQIFWGIANNRSMDLISMLWMTSVFFAVYFKNPNHEDRTSLLQFALYISVVTLLTIACSSSKIFQDFRRWSPTLSSDLMNRAVLLSKLQHIPGHPKDYSSCCFPGDHGIGLLMTGSFLLYRLRPWAARIAVLFGMIFFALPRLAGGGHWISDLLAGSMLYYTVFFSISMFAPIRERGLALLRFPAVRLNHCVAFLLKKNPDRW
jgi:membrane-associated phospholipid phosphatase